LTSIRGDAIIPVPWGRHREGRIVFLVMGLIKHAKGYYETQDVGTLTLQLLLWVSC
jgi:hypothetical protein